MYHTWNIVLKIASMVLQLCLGGACGSLAKNIFAAYCTAIKFDFNSKVDCE